MSDPVAMQAVCGQLTGEMGHLDVLFNNAGRFGPVARPDEVWVEDFDQVMAANLRDRVSTLSRAG